ncbi:MAG: 3-hydroxyacyl-CoA dehydrogenase family protein, partial [Candidatus Limnocylindrales bacterium]
GELFIEAVFEDEAVKRRLFAEVDSVAPATTSLASKTCSISITRVAAAVGPARRPRFVGIDFFSPVPVMPLIELIRGAATDDATEAYVRELAAELGKQVIVSRDRPGFIVNRMVMRSLPKGCARTRRASPRRKTSTPAPGWG